MLEPGLLDKMAQSKVNCTVVLRKVSSPAVQEWERLGVFWARVEIWST